MSDHQVFGSMLTSSPFVGYQPTKTTAASGKQKKAPGTGFYNHNGKTYYIKRSVDYEADDQAEIMTSGLAQGMLPEDEKELFAECIPILDSHDNSVFVRSTCANKWKVLYPHTFGSNFFLDRVRSLYNKKTYQIINRLTYHQKEQLAKILAACLWLGEYDCGTQNIGIDENGNVIKIDHGWGLVSVCRSKHAMVRLFEQKPMFGSRGTHKTSSIPTNHFNDFKYLIDAPPNTSIFIKALQESTKQIRELENNNKLIELVSTQLEGMLAVYAVQDPSKLSSLKALLAFIEHIKLDVPPALSSQIQQPLCLEKHESLIGDLKSLIITKLTERLIERRKSMELICILLNQRSKIEEFKGSKMHRSQADLIRSLQQIANSIGENFSGPVFNIDLIMPKWGEEVLINIFTQLVQAMNEPGSRDNIEVLKQIIPFYKNICALSAQSGYLKLLQEIELKTEMHAVDTPPLIFHSAPKVMDQSILPRQEMDLQSCQTFPTTIGSDRQWLELINKFRDCPGFINLKPTEFLLTQEEITVCRFPAQQYCAITTKKPNDRAVLKMVAIIVNMAKLTDDPTVLLRQGTTSDIIALYEKLDKLKDPKLNIKLTPSLMQREDLITQLKAHLPNVKIDSSGIRN